MKIDWNYARAFLTASEEGSFSKAALKLGLTQPTLSRQIAALEKDLNLTLFERLTTGLVLTPTGKNLLTHVKAMNASAQQFSLAVTGMSEELEGIVSISVCETDALFRMPNIIEHLRLQAPHIALDVIVSNQVSDIKKREADIAIRSFRPDDPDLIVRKLGDEPIWLYGTPSLVESYGSPSNPSDVSEIHILGFDRSNRLIDRLTQQGWNVSERHFPIVTSFQGLQWQLAKKGLGLCLLPEKIGDAETSLVRAFEPLGPIVTIPLWIVTHRELHTNLRIRKVFDLLVAGFNLT
ncbi:LysR family transcriptional regulator [Marinomonas algicola]|uniref:LysR family transcriptional regulator n=1 Tax=Marinomonas algicola TaxID=2773454 RepID=UPI00174CFFE7|nr:LysR family transcriptional regulator [Marinomonas algicola]